MSGRIIVVVSDKGGVGKTTCATSVAHGLALRDTRVLLVDFDLLGQDAIVLGMEPAAGVYEYFVLGAPAWQVIRETGRSGLHLLPGNSWTRRADNEVRERGTEPLAEQLEALAEGFDYLVIDTHPSGYLQELAIRVADVVIAPVRCEALAMDGVAATLQMAKEIGKAQQVIILPTMVDERLNAHRYNHRLLQEAYGGMVASPVPSRVAVAEAHAEGKTIWEYTDRHGPEASPMAKVRAAFDELVCWLTTTPAQVLFDEHKA